MTDESQKKRGMCLVFLFHTPFCGQAGGLVGLPEGERSSGGLCESSKSLTATEDVWIRERPVHGSSVRESARPQDGGGKGDGSSSR